MNIKKLLKLVWDEFVYNGHLTSLEAISVVFASAILLKIQIGWDFLVIIYLGTQIVYSYNRWIELDKDSLTNPQRTKYLKKHAKRIPLAILFFTFAFVGVLLYSNKIVSLLFGLLLLFLGLSYSIFLKKITQQIVGFKSFFVALIWTLLVIFLAIYYSFPMTLSLLLIFAFVYLRYFIGTIFFDIKDIKSDKKESLSTIAVILGREKTINVLNGINVLSIIPILIGFYFGFLPKSCLMLLFVVPYSFYFFQQVKKAKLNVAGLTYIATPFEKILWSISILIGKFLL